MSFFVLKKMYEKHGRLREEEFAVADGLKVASVFHFDRHEKVCFPRLGTEFCFHPWVQISSWPQSSQKL